MQRVKKPPFLSTRARSASPVAQGENAGRECDDESDDGGEGDGGDEAVAEVEVVPGGRTTFPTVHFLQAAPTNLADFRVVINFLQSISQVQEMCWVLSLCV